MTIERLEVQPDQQLLDFERRGGDAIATRGHVAHRAQGRDQLCRLALEASADGLIWRARHREAQETGLEQGVMTDGGVADNLSDDAHAIYGTIGSGSCPAKDLDRVGQTAANRRWAVPIVEGERRT